MRVRDLPTPALVVDGPGLEQNLAAMAAALPGARCRPHVKAHKCSELARHQRAVGHPGFTCATPREVMGMAGAGLGDDLLLANEVVDPERLAGMAGLDARVTVAVDSAASIAAAATAGIRECLVDVNVGMPRCGCDPDRAGDVAASARAAGLEVRGVMGYEGHVVGLADRDERVRGTGDAMRLLAIARDAVGGDIVSAGGTGTYAINELATEIQAGSYALMDTAYASEHDLPFRPRLSIVATVISVNEHDGFAVADCGLKALGMDHGGPDVLGHTVWFCSDEHVTFSPADGGRLPAVGDRVSIRPAHVDPTVAYHEALHVTDGPGLDAAVVETWPVDLRGW
ncbi:MAG TPA: alanine racemase [Acidimicrobiia bacterium]|jgi:D-serine deaminase-like pyridoxal phosphate-dependent protein